MKIKLADLGLATLTITVAAAFTACGGKDNQAAMQQQQGPLSVATMVVEPTSSQQTTTYPATIKGKTDIAIRPQVTGFITKVHVDEGQHVRKGQVLFTLDQVQFQAALDQAQAALNSANTMVNTAQMTVDNKKHLLDKNIISAYEYQLAVNDLTQAKAQQAQARAAVTNAKKNLAYTVVTAPSDGVVGSIPNREGSLASPSSAQPLTTVSDNSEIYAYFSLNEKDLLQLTDGGKYSLSQRISEMPQVQLQLADGTLYPYSGKVATVSGVIDNATGAASVRALFNNPNGMLRSGSTGQIVIPVQHENVMVIPQKATYELQDRRYVYVLSDSSTAVSRYITVDPINDGQTFVVTSGLEPGEVVITEGVGTKVREGVPIAPKGAQAAQEPAAAQQ